MSYAVQAPAAPAAPPSRRPLVVTLAATVLCVMAVAGLAYAIVTLAVAPGTVARFRDAAGSASTEDVDGFVTVVWIGAAIATVLAVILFALYVVLALALRRGSNAARIAVWVISGLGLIAGAAATVTVIAERSGGPGTGTVGAALAGAYPNHWIGWNLALSVAQMIGYALVAVLLALSPGAFFGRARKAGRDPYAGAGQVGGLPVYGQSGGSGQGGFGQPGQGGWGQPGQVGSGQVGQGAWGQGGSGQSAAGQPGPGQSDTGQPGHGAVSAGQPGYGQSGTGQSDSGRAGATQSSPSHASTGDNPWAAPAGHTPGERPADAPAPPRATDPASRPADGPDDDRWSRPTD